MPVKACRHHALAGTVLAHLAAGGAAAAADLALPLKAPATLRGDWTGGYVGAHFGYDIGPVGVTPGPVPGETLALPAMASSGFMGGLQIGYNYQLANRLVVGAEADVTFLDNFAIRLGRELPAGAAIPFQSRLRYAGTVRGRLGYSLGCLLPYVTSGLAWADHGFDINPPDGPSQTLVQFGWTAGVGLDVPIEDRWTARVEYLYADFGSRNFPAASFDAAAPTGTTLHPTLSMVRLGLNYRFGGDAPPAWRAADAKSDSEDWSIHGQSTVVEQGYFKFRSPYEGANSLSGDNQARNTVTATLFIGRRLWEGAEIYFNPEIAQGFGLSDTLGAGGFPNGEAQKSNYPIPHANVDRLFLRQTFGFGGEQETIESGINTMAGKQDISRLTFTVGKVAVTDFFDDNAYAHDARTTFLNWSIWEGGAFDYPADTLGYTYGGVAELNQKNWAVRAGYFMVPDMPNVNRFDGHFPQNGGAVVEFEQRYTLLSQPGKLRFVGWENHAVMGSYADALAAPAFLADPSAGPDIEATRQNRFKYGFVVNLEQAVNDDVGVFSRASWNNGKTEIIAFTDIDRSWSLGLVTKGSKWGRPDDKFGIAGAINGLSPEHRDFIAAGGLGVLIGDGRLNYRTENVFESYYAIALQKWLTLTLDYQLLVNPAYNADRGPVSIYAGRLHAEF